MFVHKGRINTILELVQIISRSRRVDGTPTFEVTLVTVWYTSPRSQKGHNHGHEWPTHIPFVQFQSTHTFWNMTISNFTLEIHGKSHACDQKVKVTLLAEQQMSLVLFHFTSTGPAIPETQLFKNWLWKSEDKVMAKVKPNITFQD